MSQRLVRTICPECKREVKKSDQVLKEIGVLRSEISEVRKKREVDTKNKGYDHLRKQRTPTPWLRKGEKCYEGKGCPACSNTGYKGRISIFELLIISKPIEDLIIQKATAEQIKREAIKQGMRTLYQDGFDKVIQGVTTFAEVLRVVQEEEISL